MGHIKGYGPRGMNFIIDPHLLGPGWLMGWLPNWVIESWVNGPTQIYVWPILNL